jgi:hypothetical protein
VTVVVSMRSESQKDGSLARQARRVTARRQRVANAFSNVTLPFTVRLAPTTFWAMWAFRMNKSHCWV